MMQDSKKREQFRNLLLEIAKPDIYRKNLRGEAEYYSFVTLILPPELELVLK